MSAINIRQLIDLAIGSPDPGHVNFCALHCLLYSFAEKLNIIDETVDCSKYTNEFVDFDSGNKVKNKHLHQRFKNLAGRHTSITRMLGGADPEEGEGETSAEQDASPAEIPEEASAVEDTPAETPQTPEAPEEPIAPAPEVTEATETPPEQVTAPAPEPSASALPSPQPSVAEERPSQPPAAQPSTLSTHEGLKSQEPSLLTTQFAIGDIDTQLSNIESSTKTNVSLGLSIMKDQLELSMEQLHKLAYLMLRGKGDPHKLQQVRELAKKLRSMQQENVFIKGAQAFSMEDLSLSWDASGSILEEMGEEGSEHDVELTSRGREDQAANDNYELDLHLCYSPEKILDQLLELKSEFCLLTIKMNELLAAHLEEETLRIPIILQELRDKVVEQTDLTKMLRDELDQTNLRHVNALSFIDEVDRKIKDLTLEKIDKNEVLALMAGKADYAHLQRKVGKEQMQELQCRTEKQYCEVQKVINLSERNTMLAIDNLRQSLGMPVIDEILRKFKENIDQEIQAVKELLRKYVEDTNDECAAAGARIKVLQDLACLSCDTNCVMRTVEKAKVGKLPSAKASNLLSPLITYELGSIRKSGIMGYFRKDEFPHSPNAWMERNTASMKACVPRHAGGPHTTHTAKEHVKKVLLSKK